MTKKIIIWYLLSTLSYVVFSYIVFFFPRSIGGHSLKILLSLLLVPILLYVFKNESIKVKTFKAITFSFSVIFLTFVGFLTNPSEFNFYLVSNLSTLFVLLSIIISYTISVNNSKISNLIIIFLFTSINLWTYFVGINLWINKVNFNSFSGFQNTPLPINNFKINFLEENESMDLTQIKDTIFVIDHWTSSCGACFKEFPKFEKIVLDYKSIKRIKFIALNSLQRKETPGEVYRIIENEDYNFDVGFMSIDQAKLIGVNVYPTYLIIKDNQVLYKGSSYNLRKGIQYSLSK